MWAAENCAESSETNSIKTPFTKSGNTIPGRDREGGLSRSKSAGQKQQQAILQGKGHPFGTENSALLSEILGAVCCCNVPGSNNRSFVRH